MMKQPEIEINIDTETKSENPNKNTDNQILNKNEVNVEEHLFKAIDKCNICEKPTSKNITTQTSLINLQLPLLTKPLTRNQFTQACLNDDFIYHKKTTFTATSDFDLYINCLKMVNMLNKEYASHCNFQLYQSSNEYKPEQTYKHPIKADYEKITSVCKKDSKKNWRCNENYCCSQDLNGNDNFLKSGFMFLIKNNEQNRSQRVLISFDQGLKKIRINHTKKETIQKHIADVLTKTLFKRNIPKGKDLIEHESEPSLMAHVSTIGVEKAHESPQTNNIIISDTESGHEDCKRSNKNVIDLNNDGGENLKTEYLYLPDSFRWNKTSSNVIEISETENFNLTTAEESKKQKEIHNQTNTRKYKFIREEKNKQNTKRKKLTFSGVFQFLRLRSKS